MKILVIPDVHGRNFWKEPCKRIDEFDKIVFLGDYLDPYDFEHISITNVLDNFKEIINFANEHRDKVVLLLGNHDIYYWFKERGVCRWIGEYRKEIESLFEDNKELFNIAYETELTLFTHAGYLVDWQTYINKYYNVNVEPTAESLNNLLYNNERIYDTPKSKLTLGMISRERGGHYPYGSCIWADINEHQWNCNYTGKYQVFGHSLQLDTTDYYKTYNENDIKDGAEKISETQIYEDYQIPGFAMLDCRHAFEYIEETKKFIKI